MEDTDSGKAKTKQPREKRLSEGGLSSMKRIDKSRAAEYKDLLAHEAANPTQDPIPFDFDVASGRKLFNHEKDMQAARTNDKISKELSKEITLPKDTTSTIMGITDATYRVLMPGRMISLLNTQKKALQHISQETPTDSNAIESFIKTLDGEGIMSAAMCDGEKVEEFRQYDPIISMLDSMWILEHSKGASITPETRYVWCYKFGYRVEKPSPTGGKPVNVIIVTWVPVPTDRLKKACAAMMDLVRDKKASLYCKVTFKHDAPEGPRARSVVFPRVPVCYFRNQIFLDAWAAPSAADEVAPETTQLNGATEEVEEMVEELQEDTTEAMEVEEAAAAPKRAIEASGKDAAMDQLLDSLEDEPAADAAPEPTVVKKKGGRPRKPKPDQPVAEEPKPKPAAKPKTTKQRFFDDEAEVARGKDEAEDAEPTKRKRVVRGKAAAGSKKRRVELESSDEEEDVDDESESESMKDFINDDDESEEGDDCEYDDDGDADDSDDASVTPSVVSVVSDSESESGSDGAKDGYVSGMFTKHLEKVGRKLEAMAAKDGLTIQPPITASDTWATILRDHRKFSHLANIYLLCKFNPSVSLFGGDGSDRPKTTEDIVRDLLGGPRRRPDPVTERKILELLGK